jgi:hypothetical protein
VSGLSGAGLGIALMSSGRKEMLRTNPDDTFILNVLLFLHFINNTITALVLLKDMELDLLVFSSLTLIIANFSEGKKDFLLALVIIL